MSSAAKHLALNVQKLEKPITVDKKVLIIII